jgi:hypothetical protein
MEVGGAYFVRRYFDVVLLTYFGHGITFHFNVPGVAANWQYLAYFY